MEKVSAWKDRVRKEGMEQWWSVRDFLSKTIVVEMAVALVLSSYFTAIFKSLIEDLILPILTWGIQSRLVDIFAVLHHGPTKGKYHTLADAQADGAVTLNYGKFMLNVTNFVTVLITLILLIILLRIYVLRPLKALRESMYQMHLLEKRPEEPPTSRACPECLSDIPLEARKCKFCSSSVLPSLGEYH